MCEAFQSLQDFLVAVSQLAMSRAQQAALSLIDRLEELALIPTFVQVCWACCTMTA